MQQLLTLWADGGWMMWPLGACTLLGLGIIIWKLVDLNTKSGPTRKVLREVDERLRRQDVAGAMTVAGESATPAGRILVAGLSRHEEGTERVMKAIENVGLIEMAALERGLVWLATLSNVAPLLGFLGTVVGMIQAFEAIEVAGDVEATLVARGIKVALITTAAGLSIAIPINIMHNYFVTRIDRLVIDMEESAQKMVDALHAMGTGTAIET
ncbi:MAG: MotA/TolQ/ExbB proton channel family protein [Gemmatimonadetes bacterium]|nr:MotA/TolQ/ExbB proton channel family protein [Gemmatimonadota bacterium]